MNCKNCGKDNPEDAVFCKACGKRLDGTAVCQGCSSSIPEDSAFCPYCGVKQTRNGHPSYSEPEPVSKNAATAVVGAGNKNVKTFLKYAAPASAIMTALFALIFVFFTGYVTSSTVSSGTSFSGGKSGESLFYYFGDVYKVIAKSFENLDAENMAYSDYFAGAPYIPAVFGTVIAVLTLVAVFVLSVMAIVKGIKCLAGKAQNNGGSFAVAAFLAYLAGAVALHAINNCNIRTVKYLYDSQAEIAVANSKLNGATIAGISLCSVFAIIYTAVNVASRGRDLLALNVIVKSVLAAAGIAGTITVLALCNHPAFSLKSVDSAIMEKNHISGMYLISALSIACMDWKASAAVLNLNQFTAYACISFLMLVATVVLATRVLAALSVKATENSSRKNLTVSCILVVCSLLYLAFTVAAGSEFIKALEYLQTFNDTNFQLEKFYFNYPYPIAAFVLSVIVLAVSAVRFCIFRKKPVDITAEDIIS